MKKMLVVVSMALFSTVSAGKASESGNLCLVIWGGASDATAIKAITLETASANDSLRAARLFLRGTEPVQLTLAHDSKKMNRFVYEFEDLSNGWATQFVTDAVAVGNSRSEVLAPDEIAKAVREGRYSELNWLESSDGLHIELETTPARGAIQETARSPTELFRASIEGVDAALRQAPDSTRRALAELGAIARSDSGEDLEVWSEVLDLWAFAFSAERSKEAGSAGSRESSCRFGELGNVESELRKSKIGEAFEGLRAPIP